MGLTFPRRTTALPVYITLASAGLISAYTWSLVSGILPAGASLRGALQSIVLDPEKDGRSSLGVPSDTTGQSSPSYATGVIGTKFYVSGRNGKDFWSGLLPAPNTTHTDGPFQTIARARAALRRSPGIKSAVIRAGTYSIAASLAFNWSDSGETWSSYPGETATLDGGGNGTVTVTGISDLSFLELTFENMGAGGIVFNGAKAITLRWNSFHSCYQHCVSGSSLTHSIIDSNTINGQGPGNPPGDTGTAYAAISLSYGSSNNQITHNLIENCQGGGIAFAAGRTDPPNSNNIVDRNMLQNVDTNVVDMGAIYMYDQSHSTVGNRITNNVISSNGGRGYLTNWTKSIYLDDGMTNVLVSGNICRSCGQFAWQIHAGDHNTIENNIFDLSSAGSRVAIYQADPNWRDFGMAGNVFEKNIIYSSGRVPASLYQININSGDALPACRKNLYWSSTGAFVPKRQLLVDRDPVYADPQFVRPSLSNYFMPPSSPAYTSIGFQALPADQGPVSPTFLNRQTRLQRP